MSSLAPSRARSATVSGVSLRNLVSIAVSGSVAVSISVLVSVTVVSVSWLSFLVEVVVELEVEGGSALEI